jgi:hypothetical protein
MQRIIKINDKIYWFEAPTKFHPEFIGRCYNLYMNKYIINFYDNNK